MRRPIVVLMVRWAFQFELSCRCLLRNQGYESISSPMRTRNLSKQSEHSMIVSDSREKTTKSSATAHYEASPNQ